MYAKLFDTADRTGSPVETGVITNPDNQMMPEILDLLAHKGKIWVWQMRKLFSEEAREVQSRFFVARMDARSVSTIMLTEYAGIAIFGHVYTLPARRQRGLSTILIDAVLADFRKRHGRLIILFTEYQSVAYRLYEKYGFASLEKASGIMYYPDTGPQVLDDITSSETADVRPAQWKDYPLLAASALNARDYPIKVFATDAVGQVPFETHFIYLAHHREEDPSQNQINVLAKKSNDFPVGLAAIMPDKHRGQGAYCLDAFVCSGYESHLSELMASLNIPPETDCYVEAGNLPKIKALRNLGFAKKSSLEDKLEFKGKTFTIDIFTSGARDNEK